MIQETRVIGTGFVNSGDEMAIRFLNAHKQTLGEIFFLNFFRTVEFSKPKPPIHKHDYYLFKTETFVSAPLTYVDETELTMEVPELSSLWSSVEDKIARIQMTFNGQDWVELPQLSYE
jgi:hypothetical protein